MCDLTRRQVEDGTIECDDFQPGSASSIVTITQVDVIQRPVADKLFSTAKRDATCHRDLHHLKLNSDV
jgi:hypothetical protein